MDSEITKEDEQRINILLDSGINKLKNDIYNYRPFNEVYTPNFQYDYQNYKSNYNYQDFNTNRSIPYLNNNKPELINPAYLIQDNRDLRKEVDNKHNEYKSVETGQSNDQKDNLKKADLNVDLNQNIIKETDKQISITDVLNDTRQRNSELMQIINLQQKDYKELNGKFFSLTSEYNSLSEKYKQSEQIRQEQMSLIHSIQKELERFRESKVSAEATNRSIVNNTPRSKISIKKEKEKEIEINPFKKNLGTINTNKSSKMKPKVNSSNKSNIVNSTVNKPKK